MKKFLLTFIVTLVSTAFAISFNGEILCDPVNEVDSLILSKDAVVKPTFHYIDGSPVQCLRISLLPWTSRTSLFVRIKVNNLSGKKVNFICAIATVEKKQTAQCKLVANGVELFDTSVSNTTPIYVRTTPTIDNVGSINFSFEISYASSKNISPVDLILPALIDLKKINNSTLKSDIKFGIDNSNKTWRIAGTENINPSKFKETDSLFFIPKIELLDINSKSIEPRGGMPVKIIVTLKNSGWKDYISDLNNSIKMSLDEKSEIVDEKKQTQLIPDIPAGESAEIEWRIRTHKNISEINGEIVSVFLNQKKKFIIPLYASKIFQSKLKNENKWEIIVNPKENLIAYDWIQDNLKIQFVKSSDGIKSVQFMVENSNKFETVAIAEKLAVFDIITPNNKIKTLTFLPKSARYLESPENKIILRGWIFSKETGGLIIEQYYSHPPHSSEINIETKIFTKNNLKIAKISGPVFNLEADENSTIIIPGFQLKKLLSTKQPEKQKWMFNTSMNSLIQFSKQLIPFAYTRSLGGSIFFKNFKKSFGNNNMMWLFKKTTAKTRRYTIANIAKPAFGNTLINLSPKESFSIKTSVKIIPENVAVNALLPNILRLGVIPVTLIDAEKERLIKKFIMSIDSTNVFNSDEINKQIVLLRLSKNQNRSLEITAKINKIYSKLLTKTNGNKNVQEELMELCTQLDWTLDKKITGGNIIGQAGTKELSDKILELLIEGKNTENEDAVSLAINLLSKLRNKLMLSMNNIPALSTYAKLAKANIIAYKITDDKLFLKEAERLLLLGETFMRKSSESATRGIGMAQENLGASTPDNYGGLFSAEATLTFIDALYDAVEVDETKAEQNNRIANLILNSVEKFYIQKNRNGLIPEFLSPEFNTASGKYVQPYLLWKVFLRQNKLLN